MLHFAKHAILKTNPYLRRFSTECLSFLIRKIRSEQSLKKRVGYLFSISTRDLGYDEKSNNQADLGVNYESLKADFMACLLFEILKGANGFLSD